MTEKKCFTRYAHSEGMTGLSFAGDGTFLLTCGSDGDVRVWKDLEDDDPKSHRVGESAYALVLGNDRFYVSTDMNSVLGYTLPDGGPDGIVTRSTSLFNHLALSGDGKKILTGSSDFSVKLVDVHDKSFKVFLGHDAPVLSVALDPYTEYAVSSSCDGSVRVWKLSKQNCVKSWAAVFPSSNEFSASEVLCRMSWQPASGKLLGVPVSNAVKFYRRDTWDEAFTLKDESIQAAVNCVSFSQCGRCVAAAFVDGTIVAWDIESRRCLEKQKPAKGYAVCSLEWNPNGKEIVFCDVQGRVGIVDGISVNNESKTSTDTNQVLATAQSNIASLQDLFDDDYDDDEDENTFSISKIKAETVGLCDPANVDDMRTGAMVSDRVHNVVVQPTGPKLAEPQEAFQSGSTPIYYSHRFMVWNAVGIVRSYNTADESSIDVEFHDTSVHHSLHIDNSLGHTMADLSRTAVALACVAQSDVPSKLVCVHFATWDNSKEWTVDMPNGENILVVAASIGWIAAATDLRHVRIFSVGGVERRVLELPGPVVSMAASAEERFLAVAYHRGIGFPGDQCLGLMLVEMSNDAFIVTINELPLSAKTTLAWLGFSDEESPCSADSNGIIRLLWNKVKIGQTWTQVADTKDQGKGRSSNHFVVGLSEIQQHIRCIPCKGSRYPATLPRPTITVLPFRLPLCDIQSEKGQLEETYLKQSLVLDAASRLDVLGYETDTTAAQKMSKESLMKLFALSCRSGHEFRSVELASLMDSSHTVQLAIKYASQVKRFQLAERLGRIAYEKMDEESRPRQKPCLQMNSEDEGEPAPVPQREPKLQHTSNWSSKHDDNGEDEANMSESNQDESQESETQTSSVTRQDSLVLLAASAHRNNPFKVSASPKLPEARAISGGDSKGIHLIDNLTKKSLAKTPPVNNSKMTCGAKVKGGDVTPASKTKPATATVPSEKSGRKSKKMLPDDSILEEPSSKHKSGVQMWLKATEETVKADHKKSMDEAIEDGSTETTDKNEQREPSKRKRNSDDDDDGKDDAKANHPKPSKLSAFTFNK